MEKMEAKHRQHDKMHHPMTKDQLEEVWEEQDHMDSKVIHLNSSNKEGQFF